jgi:hypothetical protein
MIREKFYVLQFLINNRELFASMSNVGLMQKNKYVCKETRKLKR